jgi:hypothetical protein
MKWVAAVDYLYFSGWLLCLLWARMALVAQEKLAEGTTDVDFYNAKVTTARFYFKKILPRVRSHRCTCKVVAPLLELDAEHFASNHSCDMQVKPKKDWSVLTSFFIKSI